MRTAIVGAGPTGLYLGMALARRGHAVIIVDRDSGPDGDRWDRKGVMQFHHPHGFRRQVIEALLAEIPDVWQQLIAAGAEPMTLPNQTQPAGFHCRRMVFERVLRTAAVAEPGVDLRIGHADRVLAQSGRAVGLSVDGHRLDADLVLDASGRGGRIGDPFRDAAVGDDCGLAYVSRQYQLLPGASLGPVNSVVIGFAASHIGYEGFVFIHDNGVISALLVRATTDRELAGLRVTSAFDAAVRAIPGLDVWTEPGRTRPITGVLPGARLHNSFRGQLTETGQVGLSGLFFVGDAVCTTNPTFGRGIATSLMQAQQLLRLLDQHGEDFPSCSVAFDAWCTECIKPWFADHVEIDADRTRRWAGQDVDLSGRLPSDLIMAAAQVDPEIGPYIGPYAGMSALPSSLDVVQSRAKDVYASGWRPPVPPGPTRDQLAELVRETVQAGADPNVIAS
jgi:2-polyprenyl-6-methoxyphenol hydroxylase-like FAD-dependent oxidoreductase